MIWKKSVLGKGVVIAKSCQAGMKLVPWRNDNNSTDGSVSGYPSELEGEGDYLRVHRGPGYLDRNEELGCYYKYIPIHCFCMPYMSSFPCLSILASVVHHYDRSFENISPLCISYLLPRNKFHTQKK